MYSAFPEELTACQCKAQGRVVMPCSLQWLPPGQPADIPWAASTDLHSVGWTWLRRKTTTPVMGKNHSYF